MGFSYRKSFKAGPIRVTASKSGISYSAGVKGARVTKRANGRVTTRVSAPGTGLSYTTSSGKATRKRAAQPTPGAAVRPVMPKKADVVAAWRATGQALPAYGPRTSQKTAELVAALMMLIGEPGETTYLIVAINNSKPLRDSLVVTSSRLILLHSDQVLRNSQIIAIRRGPDTLATIRKGLLWTRLVLRDSTTVEAAGTLHTKTLTWLRQITGGDPVFRLDA